MRLLSKLYKSWPSRDVTWRLFVGLMFWNPLTLVNHCNSSEDWVSNKPDFRNKSNGLKIGHNDSSHSNVHQSDTPHKLHTRKSRHNDSSHSNVHQSDTPHKLHTRKSRHRLTKSWSPWHTPYFAVSMQCVVYQRYYSDHIDCTYTKSVYFLKSLHCEMLLIITPTQVMVYHWWIPCETLVHTGSR